MHAGDFDVYMINITYRHAGNTPYYSHQPTGGTYGKQESSLIPAFIEAVRQAATVAVGAHLYHFCRNRVRLYLLLLQWK